jgi:hypothetical protein
MGYTKEQVQEMAAKLRAMPKIEPPPKDLTKKEVVQALAREIKSLRNKGYSLEQIVNSLKGFGLDISTPSLRSYLQVSAKSQARKLKAEKNTINQQETTVSNLDDHKVPEKKPTVGKKPSLPRPDREL